MEQQFRTAASGATPRPAAGTPRGGQTTGRLPVGRRLFGPGYRLSFPPPEAPFSLSPSPRPCGPLAMRRHYELLRATSRTFAVGIEALPGRLRDAVTLAYLVLRVADYFEDSPTLPPALKAEALKRWARLVSGGTGESGAEGAARLGEAVSPADAALPDHRAALEARSILDAVARLTPAFREPIGRHTAATTRGMVRWVERGDDFPDETALDDYMFEVAGRVGLLLTDLFSVYSRRVRERRESLLETAVSFGLGLQTVNVIRGLHEDPRRGWTYVPRHVLSSDDGDPGPRPDLLMLDGDRQLEILDFLVAKAGGHISDALTYCAEIPRRERGIRIFCAIPALLALRTAELSRGNVAVFTRPVKVSRREVRCLVLRSRLLYVSNFRLRRARNRAGRLCAAGAAST